MNTYKIFLVDDDLFCLNMHEQYLKNIGFDNITTFHSGIDCLNKLTLKPDIIFLDHTMDSLDGFEVLIKIKRFDPNINVVMVSGQEDLQTALNALKYGAFDYIIKGKDVQKKMEDVIKRIKILSQAIQKQKPNFLKTIFSFL